MDLNRKNWFFQWTVFTSTMFDISGMLKSSRLKKIWCLVRFGKWIRPKASRCHHKQLHWASLYDAFIIAIESISSIFPTLISWNRIYLMLSHDNVLISTPKNWNQYFENCSFRNSEESQWKQGVIPDCLISRQNIAILLIQDDFMIANFSSYFMSHFS